MICILGVVVGTISSFLLQRILKDLFPTLFIEITGWWMVRAAIFALVSGIVGSFYPSLKAARQDPDGGAQHDRYYDEDDRIVRFDAGEETF